MCRGITITGCLDLLGASVREEFVNRIEGVIELLPGGIGRLWWDSQLVVDSKTSPSIICIPSHIMSPPSRATSIAWNDPQPSPSMISLRSPMLSIGDMNWVVDNFSNLRIISSSIGRTISPPGQ